MMTNVTISIRFETTFWMTVVKLAGWLRSKRLIKLMMNRTIVKIYVNGKLHQRMKLIEFL